MLIVCRHSQDDVLPQMDSTHEYLWNKRITEKNLLSLATGTLTQ